MEQTRNDLNYQTKMRNFLVIDCIRGIIADCAIPALVFCATFLMPFGSGLALLAVGMIFGMASKVLINRLKPGQAKQAEFDKTRYQLFDQSLVKEAAFFDKPGKASAEQAFFNHAQTSQKPLLPHSDSSSSLESDSWSSSEAVSEDTSDSEPFYGL